MPECVMFYSHKGGAGKTTTLLNVGAILARGGHKTGLADLDIEAPGVGPLYRIDTSTHDILRLLATRLPVAEVERHTVELDLAVGAPVRCLPCSGDPDLVDRIDWTEATTTAYLRDALKTMQSSFGLEYMLLDSRSGVAPQSAFAFQQATHAVIACRLDRQSRAGVARLRTLCRQRGLPYTIVASAVPMDSPKLEPVLKAFNDEVGQRPDVLVPYASDLYFEETIVTPDVDAETQAVHQGYAQLTNIIRGAS